MASYIYCVVGLDKLLHPRIQDSNITLTEVHSQATGIKKKGGGFLARWALGLCG